MASQPPQHSTKQRLALAICHFLNASAEDGTLAPDDKESVDVAVSCISESFKVNPARDQDRPADQSLLQIYSLHEERNARPDDAATSSSSAAPAGEPSPEQKKEAESLKSKGNAAMAQKDYPAAIDLYTQALRIYPSNFVFLSNRAAAHSAAKDHAAARRDAEAAVAIDPTYTKAWSRLGLARFALGDARGAMEAYDQGIQHEGNSGSDAMKKGYETAKHRVEEMQADDDAVARGGPTPASAGGMPDLSSIISNPMFANMAQNLMSNPDLMGNLMGNPRLREMANQFTSDGGMPDFSSLLSDPNIADMARNMMGGVGGSGASGGNNASGSDNDGNSRP